MPTTLWKELNDQQSQILAGGRAGIPNSLNMGTISTYTYYNADGSVNFTRRYNGTYDAYPDGILDYKDVLNAMANSGYTLKQPVLKDPTKYFTDLTTTTSEPSYYDDGSYSVSTYTTYNFGFNYVTQGDSRVVV